MGAFVAALAAGLAVAGTTRQSAPACGVERWTVKTLQDHPRLLPVRTTTIAYLTSRPAPAVLPDTRLPFERHIFRIRAAVTLVRHEDDSDLHVVVEDARGRTMITEAPLPACAPRATTLRRMQMRQARAMVRLCPRAMVTGVAFFDFQHGQTGVAPNAIELHPILAFRCLSWTAEISTQLATTSASWSTPRRISSLATWSCSRTVGRRLLLLGSRRMVGSSRRRWRSPSRRLR